MRYNMDAASFDDSFHDLKAVSAELFKSHLEELVVDYNSMCERNEAHVLHLSRTLTTLQESETRRGTPEVSEQGSGTDPSATAAEPAPGISRRATGEAARHAARHGTGGLRAKFLQPPQGSMRSRVKSD